MFDLPAILAGVFRPLCRAESQHPLVSTAQCGSFGIWHCCVAQSGSTRAAVGVAEFTGASLLVSASDFYPLYRGINAGFALNAEATRTAAARRPFPMLTIGVVRVAPRASAARGPSCCHCLRVCSIFVREPQASASVKKRVKQ